MSDPGVKVIRSLPELLAALELDDVRWLTDVIEDACGIPCEIELDEPDGIGLRIGRWGTIMEYPFRLDEICPRLEELERGIPGGDEDA